MLNGKDEETEIDVEYSVMEVCFSFDVGRWTFDVYLLKQYYSFYAVQIMNILYSLYAQLVKSVFQSPFLLSRKV